ncbi:MAG: ribosome-associated translation inhibitor RaiA [Minisyncoccia bacterium]|jgi:ribosomal subunit interface protein
MKINIKTNLDLTAPLRTYVDEKLVPLAKFIKKFDETGEAEIWLEISRTTRHHQKGDEVFLVVADLRLPRKILRAEEYADDVRKAIDRTKDTLRLEIEKYKTKFARVKRGSS